MGNDDRDLREDGEEHSRRPEEGDRVQARVRRLIAERLFAGLSESGEVLRRGQDLVSDVAQSTKDEVLRVVGAELRGFLDKMDMADLMQEIVAGLVLEIKTEVRFSRTEHGLEPKISGTESTVRGEPPPAAADAESAAKSGSRLRWRHEKSDRTQKPKPGSR